MAVITGDIVRSAKLSSSDLDRVFDAVAAAAAKIAAHDDAALLGRVERFRGDGWQIALRDPKWSLRACLLARAQIRTLDRAFETRAVIGIGRVEHLDARSLAGSTGEAFRLSGQGLDDLRGPALFDVRAASEEPDRQELASALLALCDHVSHGWTPKQAAVFALALDPAAPGQREIGERMRPQITQQSVGGHFVGGGGPALKKALDVFERLFCYD